MTEVTSVAITTVLFVLVIVDIVGNSVVYLIIKKNRDMRSPINYLLVNLAVADILYATFVAPKVFFKLTPIHPEGMIGTILCKMLTGGTVAWIGGVSSIVTLVAIAIERHFAVMYPHGHKWKLTKAKLKVIIPGCWVFALIFIIPDFLVSDIGKIKNGHICVNNWPEDWMKKAYTLLWFVMIVGSLTLMVGLYSRVVYILWVKRNADNQQPQQPKGVNKVRKRVTLMVVTITAIFGICWGTNSVVYLLKHVILYSTGPVLFPISNTMVLFNSAVNPFVYALLNQQFREKMKKMICCTASLANAVHPTPEQLGIELTDNIVKSNAPQSKVNCSSALVH